MNLEEKFQKWSEVIHRVQEGDQQAYEKLLGELYPFIKGLIYKRLGKLVDIDDVTQNCLMGIHKSLGTYDSNKPLGPWLYAIVRFKTSDHLRKITKYKNNVGFEEDFFVTNSIDQENRVIEKEELQQTLAVIDQMPEKLKVAVKLIKLEGLSFDSAAHEMGISEAAVRKRISRAYKFLQGALDRGDRDFV